MAKRMMFLLLIVMIVCAGCKGEVYKVGGDSGWTNISPNYKSWAASKSFHVGDTLWFEYNKQFHNVVRVTHKNFNSCNSTAPYATWSTGNDSFTIPKEGHFYFICSLPDHCQSGQKVDIRVHPKQGSAPSPMPSDPSPPPKSPSHSGSPKSPSSSGPASPPSPSPSTTPPPRSPSHSGSPPPKSPSPEGSPPPKSRSPSSTPPPRSPSPSSPSSQSPSPSEQPFRPSPWGLSPQSPPASGPSSSGPSSDSADSMPPAPPPKKSGCSSLRWAWKLWMLVVAIGAIAA